MEKYERYKESGVEWIGEIPEHWESISIKHTVKNQPTEFIDGDWIESNVITSDGIRYLTTGNVGATKYKEQGNGFISKETFKDLNCTEVFPGDVLISRLNEPIGRACIVPDLGYRIVVAVDNVIYRPSSTLYDKKFIMYQMNCKPYSDNANFIARGSTMSRISRSTLGQIKLVIPSLSEQTAIANYLDKKCGEIDKVIATQERRIELLNELKQSIITKAVTRGIKPNVKLKDSGIEWIGEIPESWEVLRIRNILQKGKDGIKIGPFGSSLTGKVGNSELPYKVYGQWNIINSDYSAGESYVSEETFKDLQSYEIISDDVLISMMGTVGKCSVIPKNIQKGIMDSHVVKIRINSKIISSRFFHYIYDKDYSAVVISNIQKVKKGSIMDGLNSSVIKDLCITLPPLSEQFSIISYLDKKCDKLDSCIEKAQHQIDLLQEYKQSIITEAVTGKVKVS